jgi:hypothetical protein
MIAHFSADFTGLGDFWRGMTKGVEKCLLLDMSYFKSYAPVIVA